MESFITKIISKLPIINTKKTHYISSVLPIISGCTWLFSDTSSQYEFLVFEQLKIDPHPILVKLVESRLSLHFSLHPLNFAETLFS